MISYNKLFDILEQRNITKTELRENIKISTATLAKLSKNEPIAMKVIEDICNFLNCQPGDIMEMEREVDKTSLLYQLREEKRIKLKGGIYHQTQVKLAYNSNYMEGSKLTEDQTRYIYETNTIGLEKEPVNIDDIIETVNHFQCFDYILDCAKEILTENIIKKIHLLLKSNTSDSHLEWFNVGEYKQRPNMVGDSKTTPPGKVKKEMQRILFEYQQKDSVSFDDIVEFHYNFEKIHPFQDGNGRVGRLIIFKECLKYDIVPFIIDERHKLYYYRGLKEFESEKGYLTDTCLSAQDVYKELLRYFIGG
ncbi:MAG: helix-turn-helix domain-containing protein [Lachnospiraceae bacterium]|nr:helix-turn-helix domain-containing protein [Lachnospiraceae bacterium]